MAQAIDSSQTGASRQESHIYLDECACFVRRGSERMARRLVKLHKTGMLHLVVTPQAFNTGWSGGVEQPGDLQMLLRDFCDAVFPEA